MDRKKIVLREDQLLLHQEQEAIQNGSYEELMASRREFENDRDRLRATPGVEPSDNDVKWHVCNRNLIEYAKQGRWGLYRNTRFEMACLMEKESKAQDALAIYLEVFYLDQNGRKPDEPEPDFMNLAGFPFETDVALVAPGVIRAIVKNAKLAGLANEELFRLFEASALAVRDALKLRTSVSESLNTLKDAYPSK